MPELVEIKGSELSVKQNKYLRSGIDVRAFLLCETRSDKQPEDIFFFAMGRPFYMCGNRITFVRLEAETVHRGWSLDSDGRI